MITVELRGGLGNQMFQYAFGLRLATERRTPLTANGFWLTNRMPASLLHHTHRPFELSVFGVERFSSSPAGLIQARLSVSGEVKLLREPEAGPNALVLPSPGAKHVVSVGYWQSEAYFKPAAATVRQQFQFRRCISDFTRRMADLISSTPNAVFVHVRRGDYSTNPSTNKYHGLCSIDYYSRAVTHLQERLDNGHFYVFSDDLPWVRQHLGGLFSPVTYVSGNQGPDSWQDMFLMSQCRHAIMANSSFSWWGTWLNTHHDRIVIAPRQWFAEKQVNHILLPDWLGY